MKKIGLLLVLSLFFSCAKKNEKEYYPSGELKSIYNLRNGKLDGQFTTFYSNGNIKETHLYGFGKLKDSSVFYYRDYKNTIKEKRFYYNDSIKAILFDVEGRKHSSGLLLKDSLKIGKWNYYNENGFVEKIGEYILVKGEQYLNQVWLLNQNKDTLYGGGHYRIDFAKDTIGIDEPFQAVAYLYVPQFDKKSNGKSESMLLLNKQNTLFNRDFSNERDVALDTFYNLNRDELNRPFFPNNNPNYTLVFGKWFNSPGEKKIKGYILEYFIFDSPQGVDSIYRLENKSYFDRTIYVKDR